MDTVIRRFYEKTGAIKSLFGILNDLKGLPGYVNRTGKYKQGSIYSAVANIAGKVTPSTSWEVISIDGAVLYVYTCYEETFKEIIEIACDTISSKVPVYAKLPESMKKSHRKNFGEMLKNHQRDRFSGLVIENELNKFNGCENQPKGSTYELVLSALSFHYGNYNAEVVAEVMNRLGIKKPWNKLSKYGRMQVFMNTRGDNKLTKKMAWDKLNEFVGLRNRIAHQSEDHVGEEVVLEYIGYLRALLFAVTYVLKDSIRKY